MSEDIDIRKHRRLLERLSEDDEFRARFTSAPVEALAEHGIQLDRRELPDEVELPSKERLKKSLQKRLDAARGTERTRMWPPPLWLPGEE